MPTMIHGGRVIAKTLAREGIDCIFTLCGGHIAAIYERYGRVLSASYLLTSAPPSKRQVGRLTEQAITAGERLLTLPGGDAA